LTKTAARSGVEDRARQVIEGGVDTAAPGEKEGIAAVVDGPKLSITPVKPFVLFCAMKLAVALAAMIFLPPPSRNPADQLKVSVKVMSPAAKRVRQRG